MSTGAICRRGAAIPGERKPWLDAAYTRLLPLSAVVNAPHAPSTISAGWFFAQIGWC